MQRAFFGRALVSIATVQAPTPQSDPRPRFGATPLVPCPLCIPAKPHLPVSRSGTDINSQSLSFSDRWSRGTKTLGTRLVLAQSNLQLRPPLVSDHTLPLNAKSFPLNAKSFQVKSLHLEPPTSSPGPYPRRFSKWRIVGRISGD